MRLTRFTLALLVLLSPLSTFAADVTVRRVPDGGLEPRVAVDSKGVVHLIYFTGEDKAGDVLYRTSSDGGKAFAAPMTVNSIAGSATIVGAVRGPRLALDKDDRPHVIWSGSDKAQPKPRLVGLPLVYSRLDLDGFTPQRSIIVSGAGVDGGASIAADRRGNVDIVWHAPPTPDGDEQSRRLWVATSRDDFASRVALETPKVGACACCAVFAFYDDADVRHVIFRGADQMVHRDMYFDGRRLCELNIGKCVMSTSAACGNFVAVESDGQILLFDGKASIELGGKNPKHPTIATTNDRVLVAWTEETAWHKGGSVVWQLLDRDLKSIAGAKGRADDLPAWDYPAAFANHDGSFVILY